MTAPPRLAIVLVNDVANEPSAPHLCHRPAVDWMLDSVEALTPAAITVAGPAPDAVRERIALRPELKRCRTDGWAPPHQVTLLLPCSIPLLRPATVRRVVATLATDASADASVRAAVLAPARPAPWWAEHTGTGGPVALAVAGPHRLDPDELAAIGTAMAGDDRAAGRRRLEATGARVRTVRLGGVDGLRLTDPTERVEAENALYLRIAAGWLAAGVVVEDPATTRIDPGVRIGAGARIRPFTELLGATVVGPGSRIGPTTTVRDSLVGANCEVRYSVCQDVEIGDDANVGPFTWLRSGTRLDARCRAGAFVELANTEVGEGSAIPHLSVLSMADIGRHCNISGLTGFANYDGISKDRTRVGDNVFVGGHNLVIAPVSIGDGAVTAGGSTITEDVPGDALAVGRARQHNIPGWAARRRSGSAATAS
jgi:acetyltransferase-like isoleucine patch superfamily enzyme